MSFKTLLDIDYETMTETWHVYDPVTDETTIAELQDPTPYLEINKAYQNIEGYSQQGIKDSWWHVASIPNGVISKWLTEDGIDVMNKDHWPKVRAKLNDPEWRYLRRSLGKV